MTQVNQHLRFSRATVTRGLASVVGILILASSLGQFSRYVLGHGELRGLVRLFDLNAEANIPTYFSALMLILAAALLAVIAFLSSRRGRESQTPKWTVLAVGFLVMAIDEAVQFHEFWGRGLAPVMGDGRQGLFFFRWIVPAIALVSCLAVFFANFLTRLPTKTRLQFLAAATLYLGGAIGMEAISGSWAEVHWVHNGTYAVLTTIEESLEMIGLVVFISALMDYLAMHYPGTHVSFGD